MAGLGVQVLFGFLLSLPFTVRFVKLSPGQRELSIAGLLLAALSTALCVPLSRTTVWFPTPREGPTPPGGECLGSPGSLAPADLRSPQPSSSSSASSSTGPPYRSSPQQPW